MDTAIATDLKDAYGSLKDPMWHFARQRFDTKPYQDVVKQLVSRHSVSDTTDLNTDTSLCLTILDLDVTLRLSFVGRYACAHDAIGRLLSECEFASYSDGDLSDAIIKGSIRYLGERILRELVIFGDRQVTLFELLFSEDAIALEEF